MSKTTWQEELALGSGEIFEFEDGHDEIGGAPCEGNGGRLLTESPSTFEPQAEMDLRTYGSFAEGQQRLARALDSLTEKLRGHL